LTHICKTTKWFNRWSSQHLIASGRRRRGGGKVMQWHAAGSAILTAIVAGVLGCPPFNASSLGAEGPARDVVGLRLGEEPKAILEQMTAHEPQMNRRPLNLPGTWWMFSSVTGFAAPISPGAMPVPIQIPEEAITVALSAPSPYPAYYIKRTVHYGPDGGRAPEPVLKALTEKYGSPSDDFWAGDSRILTWTYDGDDHQLHGKSPCALTAAPAPRAPGADKDKQRQLNAVRHQAKDPSFKDYRPDCAVALVAELVFAGPYVVTVHTRVFDHRIGRQQPSLVAEEEKRRAAQRSPGKF
jgi:hypothetical protein